MTAKKLNLPTLFFLFLLSVIVVDNSYGQKKKKNDPPQKGSLYLSPVPVIGANPAFGFIYGVGGSASWFMGDPASTKISNALLGVAFTTKKQTIITLKSTVYGEDNDFIMLGDWRYLDSSQPTWGLGTGPQSARLASNDFNFDDGSIEGNSEADMMEFKFFRFYQTFLKKINSKGFYAGLGVHVDIFSDIKDQLLDLEASTPVITPYYAYNETYGFDQEKSTLVGLSFNGVLDTRDNVNNPYAGRYAMVNFKVNPTFLGSDQSSTQLWMEYRDYFNLTDDNNNILALWTYANLTVSGDLPYMNLPAIGWDQYSKSGEPYSQGRFRGRNLMFGGVEYRKHLFATRKNPRFMGAILYLNATTANGKANGINLFEYVEPGYGLGLRFNISQKARTNIGIDYGWGNYGTSGLFLRLNENF
ncbi:BamA/TamA family outer membrane protein [Echinicola vietnamensis]|uniref:Outer membrane protein/protective antigen OMA87 n=1 Tax=Echinicola vietnamensis (strain DSM 17526 / LMG 23754 / KMM 6221) TaxID=926556 RepID=L0G5Z0_ECHVK|nr:BamA/TamA family outer membrane protein [Echinicola vietnamensis]AGA80416.1 outer membrane protein/protective antigen OMA87 [Echinicola vietnamensis DSM 17526]